MNDIESIRFLRERNSYLEFEVEGYFHTDCFDYGDYIYTDSVGFRVSVHITPEELYDWFTMSMTDRKIYDAINGMMLYRGYF